jgi:AraC-like DNA-binding protein
MDDFFNRLRHVGHLPRRFPSALPVDNIGYMPHKKSWVRFRFRSYNFSFILSGGGEYWRDGVCWRVQAPCVITQAPGVLQEYGPAGEWKEWEELYLIYDEGKLPMLKKMGMIRDTPVWNVQDIGPTRAKLLELKQVTASGQESGFADRIDRLCELMVIESILGETRESVTPEERAILAIRDHVNARFLERHDFQSLARKHGLSDSTFRRHWSARIGVPPVHYVMRLRIAKACRLLVETRMKIGTIAMATGFSDPLYFYRRFRLETGVTAAAYRRSHQSPLSLTTRS